MLIENPKSVKETTLTKNHKEGKTYDTLPTVFNRYCVHVQNLSTVTIIYVLLYVLTLHMAFVIVLALS